MTLYLEKTMEKMLELFTKDLQELKNKQTEMNNTLEGINSRTDKWPGGQNGRNHFCRTEYRKKDEKKLDSLRDLWDNIKCTTGVPEGEQRQKEPKKISGENRWKIP